MINFSRIESNLFIGSAPQNDIDVARLKQMRVTAVLSLQSDQDLEAHRINWPALSTAYEKYEMVVQRFPVIDFDEQDLAEKLPQPAHALHQLLAIGHCAYVHCNAGICRAPATVLTCLCHYRGMEIKQGLHYLREQRPQIHPYLSSVEQALEAMA